MRENNVIPLCSPRHRSHPRRRQKRASSPRRSTTSLSMSGREAEWTKWPIVLRVMIAGRLPKDLQPAFNETGISMPKEDNIQGGFWGFLFGTTKNLQEKNKSFTTKLLTPQHDLSLQRHSIMARGKYGPRWTFYLGSWFSWLTYVATKKIWIWKVRIPDSMPIWV